MISTRCSYLGPCVWAGAVGIVALGLATSVLGQQTTPAADAAQPPSQAEEDLLDEQLLDELAPPAEARPASQQPSDGEDLGQPSEPGPLRRALDHMRGAQESLAAGQTTAQTQQHQQQALDYLARVIAEAERKAQQSAAGASPAAGDEPQSGRETEPSGDTTDDSANPTAGTGRAGEGQAASAADSGSRREWGHLPERVRQQLQTSAIERFLPQYEELIEQFYRRLAEDSDAPASSAARPPEDG